MPAFITRFAPSPSGALHLGHAFSALYAFERARAATGILHLRIDDIDQTRSKAQWVCQIKQDLHWLGIRWPRAVLFQSAHYARYHKALEHLADIGVIYPCSCSRGDIRTALSAPHYDARSPLPSAYPGTCRARAYATRRPEDALRLNIEKALDLVQDELFFIENGKGAREIHTIKPDDLLEMGDIVLSRRIDNVIAYALCCVLDDAHQNITEVIRGEDLLPFTPVQILLQRLLGLSPPEYCHHRLICDESGKRLAKRDDARAIASLRAKGRTPEDIRHMVGL